ncbi:MAG: FAD-dependent oxidoreductase [Bacteroidia bacterium]|nr:FAD-dependent oxidoreductase [Bacteroidia bacterium]MDW8346470.1 FAD-dependent oxidoreductase [Bacteroidia bacterium]
MIIKDILIVGGGIAGAFLQRELSRYQKLSIVWVDNRHLFASSILAAGITNPIMGKRANLTQNALTLIQKRKEWQNKDPLFAKYFVEKNAFRPFKSIDEANQWSTKSLDVPVTIHYTNPEPKYIKAPIGGIEIHHAGFMQVNAFLQEAKQEGNCWHEKVEYSDLLIEKHQIIWRKHDIAFKYIVFCEGSQVVCNPYLCDLPVIPTKGEILEIEVNEPICTSFMYSTGIYIVPKTTQKYFVGATYVPNSTDRTPTEQGKKELIQKLDAFLQVPYRVTGHWAGIRPATSDRIPVIGRHPQHAQVYFFNGLGSKGVFYAPYLAECLAQNILQQVPIPNGLSWRKSLKPKQNVE